MGRVTQCHPQLWAPPSHEETIQAASRPSTIVAGHLQTATEGVIWPSPDTSSEGNTSHVYWKRALQECVTSVDPLCTQGLRVTSSDSYNVFLPDGRAPMQEGIFARSGSTRKRQTSVVILFLVCHPD